MSEPLEWYRFAEGWDRLSKEMGEKWKKEQIREMMINVLRGGDEWIPLSDLVGRFKSKEEAEKMYEEWSKSDDPETKENLERIRKVAMDSLRDGWREQWDPVDMGFCGWLDEDTAVFWDYFCRDQQSINSRVMLVDFKEKTVTIPFRALNPGERKQMKKMSEERRERYIYLKDHGVEGERGGGAGDSLRFQAGVEQRAAVQGGQGAGADGCEVDGGVGEG